MEIGGNAAWTPSTDLRIARLRQASRAALLAGEVESSLAAEHKLARLLLSLGRLEEAAKPLRNRLADGAPWTLLRAHASVTLADLERRSGRYQRTVDAFEASADWPSEAAYDGPRRQLLLLRAFALRDMGLSDLALASLEGALEPDLEQTDPGTWTEYLKLVQGTGDHAGVVERVRAHLADPRAAGTDRAELLHLYGVSLLELELTEGESDDGLAVLEEALALGLPEALVVHSEAWRAEVFLARGEPERARAALDRIPTPAPGSEGGPAPDLALNVAALRARVALELGAGEEELRNRRADLLARLERLLDGWTRAAARPGGSGFLLFSRRRAALGQLVELELALEGPERGAVRALEHVLRVRDRGRLARGAPGPAPTLEALARAGPGDRQPDRYRNRDHRREPRPEAQRVGHKIGRCRDPARRTPPGSARPSPPRQACARPPADRRAAGCFPGAVRRPRYRSDNGRCPWIGCVFGAPFGRRDNRPDRRARNKANRPDGPHAARTPRRAKKEDYTPNLSKWLDVLP